MEVTDIRVILAPAISLLCAALVFLAGSNKHWRRFWMLSAATLKLGVVMSMLPGSLQGTVYTWGMIEFTPGIGLAFRADALGMFFAVVSSTLWVITTIYAIGYMTGDEHRVRFFGFFALCVSTTVGLAFAENLLTFFLFYEMLTICTYPLVIHDETPDALKAGRKYLTYTLIGGAFIMVGSVIVYDATGTLSLGHPGILSAELGTRTLLLIFVSLVGGFAVKAAVMPLHGWLPSAMVAPTPVSALLHAVAVVKAGAFGILRTVYNVFGVDLLEDIGFAVPLMWIAAFTILAASLVAIFQDNIKRRLAFSTISQLSYIVLGAALLTPFAATAAIVHIANQAFAKITMFFVAGAIQRTTGKTNVHELAGIGYRMPWTMGAFTVAALSFIGMPLFAGFITKWYLSLGALESGEYWVLAVMIASSLFNAAYFLPIVYLAFFKAPPGTQLRVAEARPTLLISTLVAAAYVIVLGTTAEVPGMPFSLAQAAVHFVFGM
ncbi:MAG: monovalent cation/H+ antiporter subunit D family protein [Anaerosomatales bacterium]|nr:monovalent cation/H+ antiporter subunit D family protein [Anaerosomatales bacterium]MDT8433998.1 monovalent cation/H+ antiporter subunit D family protein [Anaerosomatales bacterium]